MRSVEGLVTPQDMFSPTTVQNHALGTRLMLVDGRVFRYAQAGAVDLVAGNLLQGAVPIPLHLGLTAVVAAVGALQTVVTPGATAGAANLYAEGYLGVDTTPGNGLTYRIAGHPAITASVAFTLTLDEPVAVAFTAATRYGLMANLYKNVLQAPTTKTAAIVGVAPVVIPAASFGWIQTWGAASVLVNGTPAITAPVVNGATAAGSVDVWTAAAQPTASYVGEMLQVGVSGKNNFVYLKVAP
jgi:hypothetical protein